MAKVSVIVPTLNEVNSINSVLNRLSEQRVIDEILVVDGHSTDGTPELVRGMGIKLFFQDGKGLGKAIEKGIKEATGDIIIIFDADGSHEARHIPDLVAKINSGFDLVVASRYSAGPRWFGIFKLHTSSYDDTFIRALGNRIFTYLCRRFYGLKVHDVLMGFKAFRREVVERVNLVEAGQQFDVEIMIKAQKAGFRVGEILTVEHKRTHGSSKLSVPYHGFKVLSVIIRELFRN